MRLNVHWQTLGSVHLRNRFGARHTVAFMNSMLIESCIHHERLNEYVMNSTIRKLITRLIICRIVVNFLSLRPSVCVSSSFENNELVTFFSSFSQLFVVNQLIS